MTVQTQPVMAPPPNNNDKILAYFWPDDEISEIGDQIVNLTLLQAKELSDYLETQGITNIIPSAPRLISGDCLFPIPKY